MIVELAGLPGTGKTTLARQLAATIPGMRCHLPRPGPAAAFRQPHRFLVEALRPAGLRIGAGWPAWPRLWLRATDQVAMPVAAGGTDLLEEGIIHHTWRALFRHSMLERAPWADLLDAPHPVVVLEATRDVRRARLAGKTRRGRVNRELLADGDGQAWERGEHLFQAILAALPPSRVVIRVDTGGPMQAAVARVAAAVAAAGAPAPGQRQQAQAQR